LKFLGVKVGVAIFFLSQPIGIDENNTYQLNAALVAVDKSAGTAGRTIDCIGHTDKTDVVVVVLLTLALRPNCVWVHHLYLYFSIRSTY